MKAIEMHTCILFYFKNFAQLLSCVLFFVPHGLKYLRLPSPSLPLRFAQTHVHQVNDAIQPSHCLFAPFSSCIYLSKHQGLFQQVSSSHQATKALALQFLYQSNKYSEF